MHGDQPTPRGQPQRSGVPDFPEDGASSRAGAAARGRFSYNAGRGTGAIATAPSGRLPALTCTQSPAAPDTYTVLLRGVEIGEVRRYSRSSRSSMSTLWRWRVAGGPWSRGSCRPAAAAELRRVFEGGG